MSMNASVPLITSANNYVRTQWAAMCVPVGRGTTKSERRNVQVYMYLFDIEVSIKTKLDKYRRVL